MTDRFYTSTAWKKLRKEALERDLCCVICGASGSYLTADHIIPRSAEPDLELELSNIRILCKSCDNKRHSEKAAKSQKQTVGLDGYNL